MDSYPVADPRWGSPFLSRVTYITVFQLHPAVFSGCPETFATAGGIAGAWGVGAPAVVRTDGRERRRYGEPYLKLEQPRRLGECCWSMRSDLAIAPKGVVERRPYKGGDASARDAGERRTTRKGDAARAGRSPLRGRRFSAVVVAAGAVVGLAGQ